MNHILVMLLQPLCISQLDDFALESRRISLQNFEFGVLNEVGILFHVAAAIATAFRSTMNALGKAFTVKFQTL
jgi:hypothetical protein